MAGNHAVCAPPHAGLCRHHGSLRSPHIGPAGQHGAGHAGRDDGQGRIARRGGQGKAAGHLAHQHRQGVGQQRLLALQGQGLGLGGGHFGLHAGHVQLGHITGLLAALRQPQGVLVRDQAFIDELQFGLRGAQLQVGLRHIGLHHQARALQQRGAGIGVQPRSIAGLRQLAKQVQLIRHIEPGRAQRGGGGTARGGGTGLAGDPGRCAHLH